MNYQERGWECTGQMLFDDFSTHTPQVASGIAYTLKDAVGQVLLEQEYSNDEKMPKLEMGRAASAEFQAEISKFIARLEHEEQYGA